MTGRWVLRIERTTLADLMAATAVAFATRCVDAPAGGTVDRLPALVLARDPATALRRLLEDVVVLAEAERFAVRGVDKLVFEDGELRAVLAGVTAPGRVRATPAADVAVERGGGGGWIARLTCDGV